MATDLDDGGGRKHFVIATDLDGGGGRKGGDPGIADMVEAHGCHTEGRWIMSQPSTVSCSSSTGTALLNKL